MKCFVSAIGAGVLIGIGGIAYLSTGGLPGAVLFSVGLLSILHLRLPLFTGRAGKLATGEISVPALLLILAGNLCGTFLMGVLARYGMGLSSLPAEAIVAGRNSLPPTQAFFLGVGCGILMYIATSGAPPLLTVFCVAAFISCGFTHCIADSFYYTLAWDFSAPLPFLCTVLGNTAGCNLPPLLLRAKGPEEGSSR